MKLILYVLSIFTCNVTSYTYTQELGKTLIL